MMRTWRISDLVARLQPDPWRLGDRPFSQGVALCHEVLFDNQRSRREKADALAAWLAEFQPCLFGRMEARQRRLAIRTSGERSRRRTTTGGVRGLKARATAS
jgi:hypothetical protein